MNLYLVGTKRPWFPRYQATIFNERGQIVVSKKFCTKRSKDRWVADYKLDIINVLFSKIVR